MDENAKHEIDERVIRQQISEVENQVVALENKKAELELIKQSIDDLKNKKDSEIFVPIGAGILMHGKIVDDKNLLVNIGANVIVQRTTEETRQLIDEQIKEITKMQDSLKRELGHFA